MVDDLTARNCDAWRTLAAVCESERRQISRYASLAKREEGAEILAVVDDIEGIV